MSESLRDTITNAYDEHTEVASTETPAGIDPGKVVEGTIPAETPVVETEPKPSRTDGRARDEKGRLLPGAAKKPEAEVLVPAAPVITAKPHPARPSSWKKEYWDHWGKLDPSVAEYINQRESEYAKGVSTYKNEWDQVRPIAEAMAQFQPLLQQYNIKPETWITNLGNAHKSLALGTPEQKASTFLKLIQDYQVPIESLFVQGNDGKLYLNPQVQPFQQQPAPQPDVKELVRQSLLEERTAQEISAFATATDDKGQLKHPHLEAVRPTMTGLLQAELATDLDDAYKQALAHPRHSDIAAQVQAQAQKAELERKAKEQAATVARARSQAVSPKGSTPAVTGGEKPKGVRAAIESAYDSVIGSGRV